MAISLTPQHKQTVLWLSVGALIIILLLLLGPILTPFIAGAILAYAFNPIVDWLRSKRFGSLRFSRTFAVILVMALLIAIVTSIGLIFIPMLLKEWPLLQAQIPALVVEFNKTINPVLNDLGIQLPLDPDSIKKLLSEQVGPKGEGIWKSILASARIGGTAVLGWMWNLILIPVVLFYLLMDWHLVLRKLRELIPRRWAVQTINFSQEVNAVLAQYLRGQLLVMLILSTYYSSVLAIVGYNVALPVGIITGMLAFIPYIGFGIGLCLAAIATLLQFQGIDAWITLGLIYGCAQLFDVFIMTPKLVGERIKLHPLMVIFALLAFAQLFGFVGVLLALPSSAILSVALRHLRANYINSNFYSS